MRRRRLVIFVREPLPGRVKSRLARDIGRIEALWWYRHQCRRLIRRLGRDPRWETVLAVTPDRAAAARFWPRGVARTGQGGGDLGRRMARLLGRETCDVLIVGSDVPGITPARVAETFGRLGARDAVLAPAEDGGYALIAARRVSPLLFEGIRWGSSSVYEETRRRLKALGWRWRAMRTVWDVDRPRDLDRLRSLRFSSATPRRAPR